MVSTYARLGDTSTGSTGEMDGLVNEIYAPCSGSGARYRVSEIRLVCADTHTEYSSDEVWACDQLIWSWGHCHHPTHLAGSSVSGMGGSRYGRRGGRRAR